ncbi:hypothetical protein BX666DRAFT_2024545 [Dichotomocladium elegans]|nr:hypothetical protein BX666DRAFT_2024545 [Dichotomocladium elegans]
MSRIARPIHLSGTDTAIQEPNILRTTRIASSISPPKKTSKYSLSNPTLDDASGPFAADAPKLQRRSIKAAMGTAKLSKKAIVRTSTSSTEELSETESLSRFTPSSKVSTPRSSWTRSPTQTPAALETKKSVVIQEQPQVNNNTLVVGHRVAVPSMNIVGTLRFLGPTTFKPGSWAGIELDIAGTGKNDGQVQGVRYFTCPPQSGLFILESKVIPVPQQEKPHEPTGDKIPVVEKHSIVKTLRSSHQPMPERTRSSAYTKRSKTLAGPPQKLTPSKTMTIRSTEKRPSRFSLGSSKHPEPVPPLPRTISDISAATTSMQSQQQQPLAEPVIVETPADIMSRTPPPPPPSPPIEETSNKPAKAPVPDEPVSSNIISKDELYQIYDLLETTKAEKDKLVAEMASKEAAWEKIVSTKESYALQLREKEEDMVRLRQQLADTRDRCDELQKQVEEKEAILAQNVKDDAVLEQYQRRIEKLETIIEDLNKKAAETAEAHKVELEKKQSINDQMRHALSDQETMTTTLERECEELRRAGLDAISAYESSVMQLKKQNEELETQKNMEISHLNKVVEDLRHRNMVMGLPEEDERDDYADEWHDQRQRLEEQLELAMTELEQERLTVESLTAETDRLQKELQRLHMNNTASDDRYQNLQRELEQEVRDKRRLMEEADALFEAHARAEDEKYQMKMDRVKMERELAEALQTIEQLKQSSKTSNTVDSSEADTSFLQSQLDEVKKHSAALEQECQKLRDSNKDMEQECMRLMDEMLLLEKAEENKDGAAASANSNDTQKLLTKIENLEHELQEERLRVNAIELAKHTEINHLNKELAELESLVESRVFGEADLEQTLEMERRRVLELEEELRELKSLRSGSETASLAKKPAPHDDVHFDAKPYCDICEEYGHDVISCTALLKTESKQQMTAYCENCEKYGMHSTDDCPNQDEVF